MHSCRVVGLAVLFQNKVQDTQNDALKAFFYIPDYEYALMPAAAYHDTLLTHLWSLSVEEQFYFLWPLLLTVLLTMGNRRAALAYCLTGECSRDIEPRLIKHVPVASLILRSSRSSFSNFLNQMLVDVGPVGLWATPRRRPSAAANPQGSSRRGHDR
jgi:hypothetical protein